MSEVKVRGINIKFPYEKPYDIQQTYMSKVIDCLEDKKHGILESPTGTGKTLCLFAPVTSWLQHKRRQCSASPLKPESLQERIDALNAHQNNRRTQVLYTARTHAQIAQTMSEVRRCDVDGLTVAVLGAREQLCVHPEVMQEKEFFIKKNKCQERVKNKSCSFHKMLDTEKHYPLVYQPGRVVDIEDLVTAGKQHHFCPYYLARNSRDRADIVLMPYNYVIDREIRGDMSSFSNAIIIFDEGHNVPITCEENYEFSFSSVDMANGIRSTQELMEGIAKMSEFESGGEDALDLAVHAENSMKLMEALKAMEAQLALIKESPQLYPFTDLVKLFEKAKITPETSTMYLEMFGQFTGDIERLQLSSSFLTTLHILENALQTLFGTVTKNFDKDVLEQSFKFSVAQDSDSTVRNSKKLSLFCFNPSFGIKEVLNLNIQSMIITSGTLSPLRSFIHEMGIEQPITLENGHIASKSQIPFMILGMGVNNVRMDASFKNRNEPTYMYSLGMTLTNLILSVPDGVLLLFSSYSIMQSLKTHWEADSGIWKRLTSVKRMFIEPRGKDEFINCMENYRRAIDAGNGAVLMGVLRGKVSEGMDFKDQYCRAVFVVGVPFPPIKDPRVMGKEKYSEGLRIENPVTKKLEKLYTDKFMSVEAMKTTNQAIGRVIRHGGDYGAIILVDYRFAWPRLYNHLSRWMRDPTPSEVNFMTAKKTLREFFKNIHNGNLNVPEKRCQPVNNNGEPILTDAKYDVYDHKKVRDNPAPWIDASTEKSYRKATIKYEDSSEEEVDLVAIYKKNSASTSSKEETPEPASQSFLDALGSEDRVLSSSIQYKEIDLSAMNLEFQKRKCEEVSPSLASSPMKKPRSRRRMKLVELTPDEPEDDSVPEPAKTPGAVRDKDTINNYLLQTRAALSAEHGIQFKEAVRKYMTREVTLNQTLDFLYPLLKKSPRYAEHIEGFQVCVRGKDRCAWKGIRCKYLYYK